MHLKSFQILNFRSINDSGIIDASRITALLGRNESGKSNLLRGLHTLNPAGGFSALNPIKDFPRHRKLAECTNKTPVVSTAWELDSAEQAELGSIWPRAQGVTQVSVGRHYGPKARWVAIDVPASTFEIAEIKGIARKIVPAVKAKAATLEDGQKAALEGAADTEALVRESYAKELKGKKLSLNAHLPRIARRAEAALVDIGIEFHKTRPMRLFLSKMATDPTTVLTSDCIGRFESLFIAINTAFDRLMKRDAKVGGGS